MPVKPGKSNAQVLQVHVKAALAAKPTVISAPQNCPGGLTPEQSTKADLRTAEPVPDLYVDRLLANARRPDLLNHDRRFTVKRNGLFLGNFSLTFFSDARLEQLSKRLGNDKVKQLCSRISSVIRHRVQQHEELSSNSLRLTAGSVFEASTSLPEAKSWIQSYFDRVHPFYPFLDRRAFESLAFSSNLPQSLVQDKAWSALYHSVLALGCQAMGGGSFEAGKGEAWRLFSVSLGLFPDLITLPDSLTVLQAMAAMTIYSLGISCIAIEHVIISEAARRAQNLGSSKLTGDEAINYHKVFWVMYSTEKISSFHFGRNSVFNDHDIVCPIPSVPEAVTAGFDWFLACARYARLLSRAMSNLFSVSVLGNPKTYYLATIEQLTRELETWRLSLPPDIRPGERFWQNASKGNLLVAPAIWVACLYNSFRLSLNRATLYLAADAPEVVSKAQQAESTKALMETSRSTLELTTFIDVEPYTPLWIIGGIPLTAHFTLFDLVINNSSHPGTAGNLALLNIAGGHFSRIEYASDGHLPGSVIAEFTHIAREYVNSTTQSQISTEPLRAARAPGPSTTDPTTINSADAKMINSDLVTNPPTLSVDQALASTTQADPVAMSFGDMLYFPIGEEFIDSSENNLMGIDIMDLFNTHIPGIDPMFFGN
ncbi:hypothetical protein PFICI_01736 [Pestalotiopsis fici W106-1]|uniref:Xylanolytic transcriptional activator regulatory domain-containing protein n=1 Tax=Pestalotiopsis fici (strain W106-1 / CGMCC3.15140) TaxID=1229662 RepID=W3XPC4_PESFW|nr:uncharacterized protein PFICI_01736 [Pestalotiopsis fici W106-1]ETS87908.1 hypothetical protein PFICI_01736 [Pestalotiopsis fici W106-1]